MTERVKISFVLNPETGKYDKVRTTEALTIGQAKRHRYGLADDAPDNEVDVIDSAAQTIVTTQEAAVNRANAIPTRFTDYNPRLILDEIQQANNALDSLTLATARLFFRTTFKALAMLIINQHRIMVALRLTTRQIAEE